MAGEVDLPSFALGLAIGQSLGRAERVPPAPGPADGEPSGKTGRGGRLAAIAAVLTLLGTGGGYSVATFLQDVGTAIKGMSGARAEAPAPVAPAGERDAPPTLTIEPAPRP